MLNGNKWYKFMLFMYIQTSKCMRDRDEGREGGSKGTKRQIWGIEE